MSNGATMGYHDDTEYLSKTALTVFCDSPREYYLQFVSQEMERKQTTKAMSTGTALHAMLLENKKLEDVVGIYPPECLKVDGGLNWRPAAAYRDANRDKVAFCKAKEAQDVQIVFDAVKDSAIATAIEESSHLEKEFRSVVHGVKCKCKPDIAGDLGEYWACYDLKFMDRISPVMFRRSARSFKYHLQDAHYSSVLTALHDKPVVFKFIAVEVLFPFRVQVYTYNARSREIARDYHKKKVLELAHRREIGDWSDNWDGELILNPWDVEGCGEEDVLDWEDEKVAV